MRLKEEGAKVDIKEKIRKSMKDLQCIPDVADLSYEDLCIHLNLDLLEGFKVPKSALEGIGNLLAHLRAYYDQLMVIGRDEVVLMQLFNQSMRGEVLQWYTSHETRHWPRWNDLNKGFIERFAYNFEIFSDRIPWKR